MPFLNGLLLEKMNRNKNKMLKSPPYAKTLKGTDYFYLKLCLGVSMSRSTLLEALSVLVTVSQEIAKTLSVKVHFHLLYLILQ